MSSDGLERVVRSTVGKHLLYGPDGNRRWAARTGKSYQNAYALLPERLRSVCEWALMDHDLGAITIWLLQEYNLRRDPPTAQALVDLALGCVEHVAGAAALAELPTDVEVVGELDALDEVRPGAADIVRTLVSDRRADVPVRLRVILAYNADKELVRALRRCAEGRVEPTFANLAMRWCIPPIDILLRTGQAPHMANLSSYFPGLDRGRIMTTTLSPQEFGRAEFAALLDRYRFTVDSVAAVAALYGRGGAGNTGLVI